MFSNCCSLKVWMLSHWERCKTGSELLSSIRQEDVGEFLPQQPKVVLRWAADPSRLRWRHLQTPALYGRPWTRRMRFSLQNRTLWLSKTIPSYVCWTRILHWFSAPNWFARRIIYTGRYWASLKVLFSGKQASIISSICFTIHLVGCSIWLLGRIGSWEIH